jgi:hypothetical protein
LVIPILIATFSALFLFSAVSESARTVLVSIGRSSSGNENLPIIDWPYDQIRPAIAFNRHTNEYLVTWQNQPDADSSTWYIFGRKTNEIGSPAGSPFAVSESDAFAHVAPDVAYHDGNQEYIVVWEYVETEADHDISARRLSSSGSVIGEEVSISSLSNKEREPVIEANTSNDEYLVVWSQQIGSDETGWGQITARRLNATGAPTGASISIGIGFNDQRQPALAYDSQRNRFLIVWQEQSASGDFDIMGQLIDGSGDLIGSAIEIVGDVADQLVPQVAYNPDTQQYLVVWEDHRRDGEGAWDIKGHRLNSDGVLVGALLSITDSSLHHRLNPDVTYKSGAKEYMVVWENEFQSSDHDIYQRRIAGDGSFADTTRAISNSDRFESHPAIASDNAVGFVIAWEQENSIDDKGVDIYGAHIQVSVTPPTPTPTRTPTATPTSTSQPPSMIWVPMYLR